ncbi:hypothetical protein [Kribbella solani]|uniref:Pyridoxamine 5'-phosphate oxidase putative domain-containing protein n=1 Tax=Kribbella solani TaxID=236067 RepID=A0A841DY59_9ACTN|nr:hypothetical protein [Kribbella solani]MBB5983592.1 hypothetical protein [Kribbella solani]MDX2969999.1 hypothetical protein [Kribbella solani]
MSIEEAVAEIAGVMKKAGLVWLAWDGRRAVPAWFATVDGQYVVLADRSDSAEQPLPGLATSGAVQVVVPAKPAMNRLASWQATVRRLEPGSEEWTAAAQVLRTERLNAAGLDTQLERWRSEADILVLEPTGELTESAGRFDATPRAETPPPSRATTRGKPPITLHRRIRRRPKLS